MLGGSVVKELLELHGQRRSIREIARTLGISRNTVRKYLKAPGLPTARPRPRRPSKLDPLKDHVRARRAEGVENCVVLLRELRAQGYTGGYSILTDYVRPLRFGRSVKATVRFDTRPAGAGRLRALRVPHTERRAAVVLGLRDGAELVAAALRGIPPPG
jgi:transposase